MLTNNFPSNEGRLISPATTIISSCGLYTVYHEKNRYKVVPQFVSVQLVYKYYNVWVDEWG